MNWYVTAKQKYKKYHKLDMQLFPGNHRRKNLYKSLKKSTKKKK